MHHQIIPIQSTNFGGSRDPVFDVGNVAIRMSSAYSYVGTPNKSLVIFHRNGIIDNYPAANDWPSYQRPALTIKIRLLNIG